MTPEQMRELADELDMYVGSPTRASYYPSPVLRAADFLRQCAEQRPDGWKLVPVEPTPEMLSAVGMMDGYDWHAPGCSPDADHANWYSAMIAAAPAAPQAEPKREPLSDERIELPNYLRLQIAGTAAAHDVLVERRRQIDAEGWTPEHDDEHGAGELARAAAAYALDAGNKLDPKTVTDSGVPSFWPWHGGRPREARWWKPGEPRRNLVKAGALILAEIERIDRMGGSDAE